MIGASAEVAILKLFCIFNNLVSFSRRKYPAKHNILPPTLENSRYIFSIFFSIFRGIQHKFWSGNITISIMSEYKFFQYSWIALSAAAAWKSLHIFWAQTLMTPAMRQFKRCNLSSITGQPYLMFDGEGSQSDGANYSLGNQRSSPQFPRYTLRAPARRRSASWRKMIPNWKGKVGW